MFFPCDIKILLINSEQLYYKKKTTTNNQKLASRILHAFKVRNVTRLKIHLLKETMNSSIYKNNTPLLGSTPCYTKSRHINPVACTGANFMRDMCAGAAKLIKPDTPSTALDKSGDQQPCQSETRSESLTPTWSRSCYMAQKRGA